MSKTPVQLIVVLIVGVAIGIPVGRFVLTPEVLPLGEAGSQAVAQDGDAGPGTDASISSATGGQTPGSTPGRTPGTANTSTPGAENANSTNSTNPQAAAQRAQVELAQQLLQRLTRDLPADRPAVLTGHYFNERLKFRVTKTPAASASEEPTVTLLLTDRQTGGPVIAVSNGTAMVWDLLNESVVLLRSARPSVFFGSRGGGIDLELGYRPLASAAPAAPAQTPPPTLLFDAPAVLSRVNGEVQVVNFNDGTVGINGVARLGPADDPEKQDVVVLRTVFDPVQDYPLAAFRMFRDNRQAMAIETIKVGPAASATPNFRIPDVAAFEGKFKVFDLDLANIAQTQAQSVTKRGLTTTYLLAGLIESATQEQDRAQAEQLAGYKQDWDAVAAKQQKAAAELLRLLGVR